MDKNVIKQAPCWTEQEEGFELGVTGYHSIIPGEETDHVGLEFSVSLLENGLI